jgi:hypothetical protein
VGERTGSAVPTKGKQRKIIVIISTEKIGRERKNASRVAEYRTSANWLPFAVKILCWLFVM